MRHLPQERLGVSVKAIAACRAIFEETLRYCGERRSSAAIWPSEAEASTCQI
jgi:alkylation response protein AidB-like acyl-CoA dehydrogenase